MRRGLTRRELMISGIGAGLVAGAGAFSFLSFRERPLPYKHVILLVVDTLRADRLGCYGYSRNLGGVEQSITPHLDALGDSGAVFEQAWAQSDWTETSMASMFFSVNPVIEAGRHTYGYLPPPDATLHHMLDYNYSDARPHAKVMVQSNVLLVASPLSAGFDIIENLAGSPRIFRDDTTEPTKLLLHTRADVINAHALDVIDEAGDDNLFLYVHYMDVHETYSPVSRFARLFESLPPYDFADLVTNLRERRGDSLVEYELQHLRNDYDASLMFLDEQIGALLQELKHRGIAQDSLIILASDHGQSLGEHDAVGHGQNLYPEQTRVPLIITGAGIPSVRVQTRVRNIDVIPTIAGYLGQTPRTEGESLLPLIEAASEGRLARHKEVYSCMDYPPRRPDEMQEMVISPSGLAYIKISDKEGQTVSEEFYDTARDPGMVSPIDGDAYTETMRARLSEIRESVRGEERFRAKAKYVDDDPVRTEQYRSLGYL